MSKIMGFDLGAMWGWSRVANGKLLEYKYEDYRDKNIMERVAAVYLHTCHLLDMHKPVFAMIEEPPFVQNPKIHAGLARLEAAVWLACEEIKIPYYSEQNKIIKGWFTGDGGSKKADIMEEVLNRYSLERKVFKTKNESNLWENAYDAAMIASYGEYFFNKLKENNT